MVNSHSAAQGRRPVPRPAATLRLSVVVPVYNEAATLEDILRRLRLVPLTLEIIAVDDCSRDESPAILARLLAECVVDRVLHHEVNRGKGAALRTGFAAATGDVIVPQDADLEYDPYDFVAMLDVLARDEADAVYGSRFLKGRFHGRYLGHLIGNRVLTWWSNRWTGLGLTDMETCYKMVKAPLLQSLVLTTDRFGIEPELTARLAQAGARVVEVPVSYAGRSFEAGKKITWKDGLAGLLHVMHFSLVKPTR